LGKWPPQPERSQRLGVVSAGGAEGLAAGVEVVAVVTVVADVAVVWLVFVGVAWLLCVEVVEPDHPLEAAVEAEDEGSDDLLDGVVAAGGRLRAWVGRGRCTVGSALLAP
jgi:hypothetical protein